MSDEIPDLKTLLAEKATRPPPGHRFLPSFDYSRRRVNHGHRESRRILFLFVVQRGFASDSRLSLSRDALVDGNPMQPGRNFRLAAKSTQVPKRGQKRLLRRVARVLLAPQNAVRKREDTPLPAPHNLAESVRFAGQSPLHDDLVGA